MNPVSRSKALVAGAVAVIVALFAATGAAQAQVPEAFKNLKGKADAFGGAGDNDGMGDAAGSIALPFAPRWFVQGDGLIGSGRGDANWALGGHIYWHNPKIGLIDLNISFLDLSARHVTRVGVHGQFYWGKVTIRGNAGYQIVGGVARDSVFGGGSVAFHGVPRTLLEAGADGYSRQGIGWAHAEYLLPLQKWLGQRAPGRPISFWVNGGAGNDDYWHVLAGIRVHFGGCGGSMTQLARGCGAPNFLRRLVATLRPVLRRDLGRRPPPGGGGGGGPSTVPSDRRLKTDVVLLAALPNGLRVYSYRYVWGGPRRIGVMAQDVLLWRPDAVVRGPLGFLRVDYRRLDLD